MSGSDGSRPHFSEPGQSATPGSDTVSEPAQQRECAEVASGVESKVGLLSRLRNRLTHVLGERRTPAFLLSMIVHTAALLLLALWSMTRPGDGQRPFEFLAVNATDRQPDDAVEMLLAAGDASPPPTVEFDDSVQQPAATPANASAAISELLATEAPAPVQSVAQNQLDRLLNSDLLSLSASFASTGVEGRQPEQRREIALKRGGTLESEQAVERALDWLAAHQLPSGAWSLIHDGGECQGRCANNGSKDRFDTAATGLSLLAFLGAGYTHQDGKHRDTVRKGVYFLMQVIEETPQGGSFMYQCDRGMYNHGIAAFALCEAYQLTGDKELRRAAQLAIDFIQSAQSYQGGWGYLPKQPGDLTISGWQIMALKSAFAAGLDVPASTIMRLDPFLDSQQNEGGTFFGYGRPGKSPTCTAIGLMVRMFRGMSHTDPKILDGASYFRKVGRSNGDVYFNYYAGLFLFHVGGKFWEDWNPTVRDHLVSTQAMSGHEKGSWYFENPYGKEGGRLYTTAMCAMTLEVYYRFSPLYQQTDITFEL